MSVIETLKWSIRRLVDTPMLPIAAAIGGAAVTLLPTIGLGPLFGAIVLGNLYVHAVIFRHVGLTLGDVEGTRDLLGGAIYAVPSMIGVVLWWGFSLLLGPIGIIPRVGVSLGIVYLLFATTFFSVHTILAFPAVCTDKKLVSGLYTAWGHARGVRWKLMGLLVLTQGPLLVPATVIIDGTQAVLLIYGAAYGSLLAITNVSYAHIYLMERSNHVEGSKEMGWTESSVRFLDFDH